MSDNTSKSSRGARWALVLAAAVMSGALLFTAWSSHASVREASRTVARGQGNALLDDVRAKLGGARPTAESLAELLDAHRADGLRYLGLGGRGGLEAGDTRGAGAAEIRRPHPGAPLVELTSVGGRYRLVAYPPAPPPMRGPPPPGGRPPESRAPVLPPLVMEFESVVAEGLVSRARRTALFASAAALALMIASLVAFRWLRRREEVEAQTARERHLATLGEMSAVLAHEIRNPLASLKGHAQLLAEALPEGENHHVKAELVVSEARRLEVLTTTLLEFVRTGAIHRTACSPGEVLGDAAREVSADRIEVDDDGAPGTWSLDGPRMHQVLANVLRNAVQASPDGERVTARVTAERDTLVYEVRDRGKGIETGSEAAIFEPFHTGRVYGTGLGLAVAKRVVELHGGAISASNHAGGGAVFRMSIPRGSAA